MSQKRRRPAPLARGNRADLRTERGEEYNQQGSMTTLGEAALTVVRRIWWREIAAGGRFPALRGFIIIDGGAI